MKNYGKSLEWTSVSMVIKDPIWLTLSIFVASSAWFLGLARRSRQERNSKCSSVDSSTSLLSARGSKTLSTEPLAYMQGFLEALKSPCEPTSNPEGYISLCVAENTLVQEKLAHRLMQPDVCMGAFSNSVVYNYNSFLGLPVAREAVAKFLQNFFTRDNEFTLKGENVVIGSGAGGLLNHLFFSLAEANDAVLIPAPYYAKFENDMTAVANLVPIPVHSIDPTQGPTPHDLNIARTAALRQGLRPKILLINNPNNPLGVIYQPKALLLMIQWARSHKMHIISNEIYALSVHNNQEKRFQSVLQVLNNDLCNDVHFLYALSKDFGACGFRIGFLYTQNSYLISCLSNLNTFSAVSQPMQLILTDLLNDVPFLNYYLDEARLALLKSYNVCTRKLNEMVISFVPASAGCFIYVDFSTLLPSNTKEGEDIFAKLVQDVARIIITPGSSMRDCKFGMFRVCYAWVTPEVLEIAMERLSYIITKIRKIDWDDLAKLNLSQVTKNALKKKSSFMSVMEWSK